MTSGGPEGSPAWGVMPSGRAWAADLGPGPGLVVAFVVSGVDGLRWWESVLFLPGGWVRRGFELEGPRPSLEEVLRPVTELPDGDREDLLGRFADPLPFLCLLGVMAG
jgi:hypothetical protein